MGGVGMYQNLRAEMARNNLHIGDLAKVLEVRCETISGKMNGKSQFYYDERLIIRDTFFPSLSVEYLFEKDGKSA